MNITIKNPRTVFYVDMTVDIDGITVLVNTSIIRPSPSSVSENVRSVLIQAVTNDERFNIEPESVAEMVNEWADSQDFSAIMQSSTNSGGAE